MLHFINELWSTSNQIKNLMLVALSTDCIVKLLLRRRRQEMSNWLNRKVNRHDFTVFLYLNISCVFGEKLVNDSFFKHFDLFLDIRQSDCQLVDEAEDVEAFRDGSFE